MKKTFCIVISVLFIFVSTNSFAENWVLVSETKNANVYIDTQSISKTGNATVKVNQVMNFSQPVKDGFSSFSSLLATTEFNCSQQTSRRLQIVSYAKPMLEGKIISNKSYNEDAKFIQPNTSALTIYRKVCSSN